MELTDIGGWAAQLLAAGTTAFIGAYWSVSDEMACLFATTLYESLANEQELGAAVRKARLAIKRDGDPTWLAYTVFTDPFARWRDAS
jgi:CHAT domain-containing protein